MGILGLLISEPQIACLSISLPFISFIIANFIFRRLTRSKREKRKAAVERQSTYVRMARSDDLEWVKKSWNFDLQVAKRSLRTLNRITTILAIILAIVILTGLIFGLSLVATQ